MGKTRFRKSTVYGLGFGIINDDGTETLLFDKDAGVEDKALIADEELEGTMTQDKAVKVTLGGVEYFIPLIHDGGT